MNSGRLLLLLCKKRVAVSSSVMIKYTAHQTGQSIHHFATSDGHFAAVLSTAQARRRPFSNNQRILIHSRGFRRKTAPSSTTKTISSQSAEDSDPIKFREMFDAKFAEFQKEQQKRIDDEPMNFRNQSDDFTKFLNQSAEDLSKRFDEFIVEFNKENAGKGFKIEREQTSNKAIYKLVLSFLFMASAAALTVFIIISLDSDRNVISEHRATGIMEQSPITLDQLIQLICLGKVQDLTYHERENKVVAKLHPGVIVDGKQQANDLISLNVHLDEAFRSSDPQLLNKHIREEVARLWNQRRDAIIVQQISFYILIGLTLWWIRYASKYARRLVMNENYRVVPTTKNSRQQSSFK